MTLANTPCEKQYIPTSSKSGLSLRPLNILLKSIFKKKDKKRITKFHDLHHFSNHLKSDLGICDIRPPLK